MPGTTLPKRSAFRPWRRTWRSVLISSGTFTTIPRDSEGVPLVLELVGIHKRFGSVQALRGADFSLAAGELHALLGENGAGKTTLRQVAFGLLRPDAGEVLVG